MSADHPDAPLISADEALARLKAGNQRFLNGESHVATAQKDVIAGLVDAQQPYVTILGCSDSRVPPEIVFDASFGELFVIRVAGNVLGPSILGTLQYARLHLHTPLFVVMGHEGCGAVKAAIATRFDGSRQASRIEILLEQIIPALDGLDPAAPPAELLSAGVEANVRRTIRELLATPEASANTAGIKLVGAVYEIETGRVRFLE